jgi:diguanylate cyclase (GGDEF)-like protein
LSGETKYLEGLDPFFDRVKAVMEKPEFKDNPLLGPYRELAKMYETVTRTLMQTVRISDDYQGRLKELNEALADAMRTDYLTGLMNRRAFAERLKVELARSSRYNRQICFLMADVDHFKTINDKYGHDVGDAVLKETAKAFKLCLRSEDIKARWGGEEFLALLPETDESGALRAAEKLRSYIEKTEITEAGNCIKVTISIGVAEKGQKSPEEAIKDADSALYEAKTSGRNRVVARNGQASLG